MSEEKYPNALFLLKIYASPLTPHASRLTCRNLQDGLKSTEEFHTHGFRNHSLHVLWVCDFCKKSSYDLGMHRKAEFYRLDNQQNLLGFL